MKRLTKVNKNYKKHKILLAKKSFSEDLKSDIDFIHFKNRCELPYGLSYGCVVATHKVFLINDIRFHNEQLISNNIE
jgi:hypothetical protein